MKLLKTTKNIFIRNILGVAAILMIAGQASAQVSKSLDSLGSNESINKKIADLESRSRFGIVQGRAVPRDMRFEIGASYGPVAAGDSYLQTQNMGGQIDFHFTPKFSLGVRYAKAFNSLTSEGERRFEEARVAQAASNDYRIPDIDYPEESLMGVFNWYMTYGKLNLFDVRVVQFDIYSLGGYGQVKLKSGATDTWTAGGGIGFWLTNRLTSRFELRYQAYQDKVYTGNRDLNLIVANFGIGLLL